METLLQDLRHAVRSLRNAKAFATVAVIALALGIGANTVLFSVISYALLRPLPFPEPDRLVVLSERTRNLPQMSLSLPDYLDWEQQGRDLFTAFGGARDDRFNLTGSGEPERISGWMVSAGIFPALEVAPALGRFFGPDDDRPGAPRTVVISHPLWRRLFHGEPSALGRALTLSGETYTVIGVLPEDFDFLGRADVYVPLKLFADRFPVRGNRPGILAYGRMRPGVTVAQVQKEFDAIADRVAAQYEQDRGVGANVRSLREDQVQASRPALLVLWGAVAFVLLIAAANVANLLLARATAREGEIAVRVALGAGRGRIVRLLLTESVLLSLLGAGLALLLAWWGLAALAPLLEGLPRSADIHLDGIALAFTLVLAVLTGIAFGLYPALRASSTDVHTLLKDVRGAASHARLRGALIVAEVALSMVLLIGAGLLLRSFGHLTAVNPGFDPAHVLTLELSLPATRYGTTASILRFEEELERRVRELPQVTSVAVSCGLPFVGAAQRSIDLEDWPVPARGADLPLGNIYPATPGYLETMRIPLLSGRFFTAADDSRHPVAVIDEPMAKRLFPGVDPIGHRLRRHGEPSIEIVGVVGHAQNYGLDGKGPVDMAYYIPWRGFAETLPQIAGYMNVIVRTSGRAELLAAPLRRIVQSIDPQQPVWGVQTMEEAVSKTVTDRRLQLLLLGIFAAVALLLASVGIYGVMSYSVAQRTREIGIRMALGAARDQVLGLVVGQGVRLALLGIGIGVVFALLLSRVLAGLLFGISATDPVTYVLLAVGLGAVAALACLLPAARAVRVDPAVALRSE